MERKYAAFISYRHTERDSAVAKAVHSLIEQYHIPRAVRRTGQKKLGLVFRDQEELSVSNDLSEEICHALDNAEHLIVICSPETADSAWVPREIERFLAHHDRDKVFLVLAGGEPEDVFPKALTQILHDDGTVTKVEPLAADVRAESVGGMRRKLRGEILRLLAPMIGCPYDALMLRERKRRRKKCAAVMAAVLAAAVGIGAAWTVIAQKNRELALEQEARQQEAVQQEMRQQISDAETALEAGDYLTAARNAVAALENGTTDSAAERVLMEVLHTFGSTQDQHWLITDTVLAQNTPVADFSISEDGTRLVTTDEYGTLNAYDTATAERLWTIKYDAESDEAASVGISEAQNAVLRFHSGRISAFGLETGAHLWDSEAGNIQNGQVFTLPDGSGILCVSITVLEESWAYDLQVISLTDGRIRQSLRLTEDPGAISVHLSDTGGNGGFSEDGGAVVGTYFDQDQNGNDVLHCYLADLTAGAVRILYTTTLDDYYFRCPVYDVHFMEEGAAVLVVRSSGEDCVGIVMEKIDVQTGALLWRAESPAVEEAYYFDQADKVCGVYGEARYYIARKDRLYAFDLQNGVCMFSETLSAGIVSMDPVEGSYFGYLLEDGSYQLGWANSYGFSGSAWRGGVFEFETAAEGGLWNGGFMRLDVKDGSVRDILLGNESDSYGYLALVPAEDRCRVILKRILKYDTGTQPELVDLTQTLGEDAYLPGSGGGVCQDDKLILGPFRVREGEETWDEYAVFDAETRALVRRIRLPGYTDEDTVYFLPDGLGCVVCDYAGNITFYDALTETAEVLSEEERITMKEGLYGIWTEEVSVSYSAVQKADGSVLTALCDGETLTLWRNGQRLETVALPEEICWQYDTGTEYQRQLRVGGNGYVVLTDYPAGGDVGNFVAYDTSDGTWHSITAELNTANCAACFLAEEHAWLGAFDSNGNFRVIDMLTGETVSAFSLQMPISAMYAGGLTRGDSLLRMKTVDSQLLLYDVQSGQLLFRDEVGTSEYTFFTSYVDEENGRLYVANRAAGYDDNVNGICIDMTTWEKLADIENMLCFDPKRGELYRYDYVSEREQSCMIVTRIPNTAELMELAKDALNE